MMNIFQKAYPFKGDQKMWESFNLNEALDLFNNHLHEKSIEIAQNIYQITKDVEERFAAALLIGDNFWMLGERKRSEEWYHRASASRCDNPKLLSDLYGRLSTCTIDVNKSVEFALQAFKLNEDDPHTVALLANSCLNAGDISTFNRYFNWLQKAHPHDKHTVFLRAELLFIEKNYEQAAVEYRHFLQSTQSPFQFRHVIRRLARSLYLSGEWKSAVSLLNKIADQAKTIRFHSNQQAFILLALGDIYRWKRLYWRARPYYLQAINIYPRLPEALQRLALCHTWLCSWHRAVITYEQAIKLYEETGGTHLRDYGACLLMSAELNFALLRIKRSIGLFKTFLSWAEDRIRHTNTPKDGS